jgi:TonB-linked SusC/RagA family outer membrane protein
MKKLTIPTGIARRFEKNLLKMKLTATLFFVSLVAMSATSYSQSTRFDISMSGKNIIELFREIEAKGNFYFFYQKEELKDLNSVTVTRKNANVSEILDEVLTDTGLAYKVIDRYVIVTRRENLGAMERATVSAQQGAVSGMVTDKSGAPLPGVTVVVKGTTTGTITGSDGQYMISNVPANATLVFSFVGMRMQEIETAGKTTINVTLTEEVVGVDEVVIVGYGSQRKANLTGAVSTVSLPQMEKRTVAQTSLALQGLVPGVTVTQRSGKPGGDGGTIRIRGNTTIGNNDPLVLIDGVESSLNNIDAESIETISVLKDAASSAIYGNRAANGVILIKTKRAESGKAYVSYKSFVARAEPTNVPKYVGAVDFMKYISIAKRAVGMTPEYTEEYIKKYEEGVARNDPNFPDVDWFDATATNNGLMTNHFVTVGLGTERLKSMTQAGYISQNGITENTNFKRYTLRSNNDYQVLPKLAVTSDISLGYVDRKEPAKLGSGFNFVGRIPSNQAAYLADGRYGPGWQGINPVAYYKDGGILTNVAPSAILNFTATFNPIEDFELHGQYALNYWEGHTVLTGTSVVQLYLNDGTPDPQTQAKSTLTETAEPEYAQHACGPGYHTISHLLDAHNFKVNGRLSAGNVSGTNGTLATVKCSRFRIIRYSMLGVARIKNRTALLLNLHYKQFSDDLTMILKGNI